MSITLFNFYRGRNTGRILVPVSRGSNGRYSCLRITNNLRGVCSTFQLVLADPENLRPLPSSEITSELLGARSYHCGLANLSIPEDAGGTSVHVRVNALKKYKRG